MLLTVGYYLLTFIGLWFLFGFLSTQAGYSLKIFNNKLQTWQQKIPKGNRIPEVMIAVVIATICLVGFYTGVLWKDVLIWVVALAVSFAGKESASVFHLPHNWLYGWTKDTNKDGKITKEDARNSTLRFINDFKAKVYGVKVTSTTYARLWTSTKGFITTLPIGGLGGIFAPYTRHLGVHLGKKYGKKIKGLEMNTYAEWVGDGTAYALASTIFLIIVL